MTSLGGPLVRLCILFRRNRLLPMACVSAVAGVAPMMVVFGGGYNLIRALAGVAPVSLGVALLALIRAGARGFPIIIRARDVVAARGNGLYTPLTMSVCAASATSQKLLPC